MTEEQSRVRGARAFAVSTLVLRLVNPVALLLVARALGEHAFGVYAAIAAITAVCGLAVDFGLQPTLFAWSRRGSLATAEALFAGAGLSVAAAALMAPVALLWSALTVHASPWCVVGLVGLVAGTALGGLAAAAYQADGRYDRAIAFGGAVSVSGWIGLAAVLAFAARTPASFAVGQGLPMAVAGFGGVCVAYRSLAGSEAPGSIRSIVTFARSTRKFGMSAALYQTYARADQSILASAVTPTEVGAYTVAYRSIDLALAIPTVLINQILWPRLFRSRGNNPTFARTALGAAAKAMFVAGTFLAASLSLTAPAWTELVFGTSAPRASQLAHILVWVIPLQFLASAPMAALTTHGYIGDRLKAQAVTVGVNVVVNAAVVEVWGAKGCAFVMIASAALLLGLAIGAAERRREFARLWSPYRWRSAIYLAAVVTLTTFADGLGAAYTAFLILAIGVISLGVLFCLVAPAERRLFFSVLGVRWQPGHRTPRGRSAEAS